MDGPRVARPEEVPAIIDLADQVFCDENKLPRTMAARFPFFLSAANVDNMYVVADGPHLASFLGIDLRTVVTAPRLSVAARTSQPDPERTAQPSAGTARIPCALVGAVCTHIGYRGQQLSGKTLDLAYRRSRQKGAVLAWISGNRNVYYASGAEMAWPLNLLDAELADLQRCGDAALTVAPLRRADVPKFVALHDREPMRFEWDRTWLSTVLPRIAIESDFGRAYLISRGGQLVAAAALATLSYDPSKLLLQDWYGDRPAVVGALAEMVRQHHAQKFSCRFVSHDAGLMGALKQAGLPFKRFLKPGWTLKVLDFAGLLRALAPLLAHTLGPQAGAITATENGIRVTLPAAGGAAGQAKGAAGAKAGVVEYESPDERTAVQMIFSVPEDYAERTADMPPAVRAFLDRVFPVPLQHYGLNYI